MGSDRSGQVGGHRDTPGESRLVSFVPTDHCQTVVDLRVVNHRPLGNCLEKRSQSHEEPRASVFAAFPKCSSVNRFFLYAIDLCR
jgi:hypothetical protein